MGPRGGRTDGCGSRGGGAGGRPLRGFWALVLSLSIVSHFGMRNRGDGQLVPVAEGGWHSGIQPRPCDTDRVLLPALVLQCTRQWPR